MSLDGKFPETRNEWNVIMDITGFIQLFIDNSAPLLVNKINEIEQDGLLIYLLHCIEFAFYYIETDGLLIYLLPYFYISNGLCFKSNKIPYFEYFPLINSRIHSLGSSSKQIMNYNLRSQ